MPVVLTELSERILTVTVHRPEKLNALNAEVVEELRRVFHEAKTEPEVGAVIVTGAGEKAFVAGADISGFPSLTPVAARDLARKGQAVVDLLETMGKPSIAAVNSFALEAVNHGLELPFDEAELDKAALFGLCVATDDTKEGVAAFLEERPAKLAGR